MKPDPDVRTHSRVWTLSNLLSSLRILLAIPIALLLVHGTFMSRLWAVLIMLAASLTDFLDGYFARRHNEVTELGKIIDPVADKITISIIALILAVEHYIPIWFFAVVIARDFLILLAGFYLRRSKGIIFQSNWIGKWTVACIAGTIVAATLGGDIITDILMAISTVMVAWSFGSYAMRFAGVLKRKE